jgi:flagellar protein FliO/FliZ
MPSPHAALIALALVLVAAPPAAAADGEGARLDLQEEAPRALAGQAGSSSTSNGIVRTIVGLAIVLAVIYGLTWVLRQVKRSKDASASGSGLETLATLPLGQNRSLHLVRAGEEVVLLGAGEGAVTPIRTYRADEARALGLTAPDGDDRPSGDGGLTGPERGSGLVEALRRRTVIR